MTDRVKRSTFTIAAAQTVQLVCTFLIGEVEHAFVVISIVTHEITTLNMEEGLHYKQLRHQLGNVLTVIAVKGDLKFHSRRYDSSG